MSVISETSHMPDWESLSSSQKKEVEIYTWRSHCVEFFSHNNKCALENFDPEKTMTLFIQSQYDNNSAVYSSELYKEACEEVAKFSSKGNVITIVASSAQEIRDVALQVLKMTGKKFDQVVFNTHSNGKRVYLTKEKDYIQTLGYEEAVPTGTTLAKKLKDCVSENPTFAIIGCRAGEKSPDGVMNRIAEEIKTARVFASQEKIYYARCDLDDDGIIQKVDYYKVKERRKVRNDYIVTYEKLRPDYSSFVDGASASVDKANQISSKDSKDMQWTFLEKSAFILGGLINLGREKIASAF